MHMAFNGLFTQMKISCNLFIAQTALFRDDGDQWRHIRPYGFYSHKMIPMDQKLNLILKEAKS